ncbi:MAG TPA: hypothetical protein ENO19_01070 [Halothiobacillaceae bacterium]|nr:hypothetical protein [Halothiobacillaceae bacterium]
MSWIDDFNRVVGGVSDVIEKTRETIDAVTGRNDSDPLKVPDITAQDQETKNVQGASDVQTPVPVSASWLVLVGLGLLVLALTD